MAIVLELSKYIVTNEINKYYCTSVSLLRITLLETENMLEE